MNDQKPKPDTLEMIGVPVKSGKIISTPLHYYRSSWIWTYASVITGMVSETAVRRVPQVGGKC